MMNDKEPIATVNSIAAGFVVMVGHMCKHNYVVAYVPERKLCSDVASGVPIPREDYKALPLVASFPGCSASAWGLVVVSRVNFGIGP